MARHQCKNCRTRDLEVCSIQLDASGALMACTQCVQSKKGCQYANNGQGRPPVNYPTKSSNKSKKNASAKSKGRSNIKSDEKDKTVEEEKPTLRKSERKRKETPTRPRLRQHKEVEVVVPTVKSTRDARIGRTKSREDASPPRKKPRTRSPSEEALRESRNRKTTAKKPKGRLQAKNKQKEKSNSPPLFPPMESRLSPSSSPSSSPAPAPAPAPAPERAPEVGQIFDPAPALTSPPRHSTPVKEVPHASYLSSDQKGKNLIRA